MKLFSLTLKRDVYSRVTSDLWPPSYFFSSFWDVSVTEVKVVSVFSSPLHFCPFALQSFLVYPAACWPCPPSDRKTDVRPVSLSPSLSVSNSLSRSLSLSLFHLVSAAVQILAFLHSSVSLLRSTQLFHALRHAEAHTHTHTHTHTQTHTHTHISWSSCRTRGREKRLEEIGPKSCSRLQTAGNVELMSICLSVPGSSPCLSVSPSVFSWFVNICVCCCCRVSPSQIQKKERKPLD